MIIGISGKMGSGKDTVCNMINAIDLRAGWKRKSFAAKLKQIAGSLANVDPKNFEDQNFKNLKMESVWTGPDGQVMTYREFLQKIGTDALRTHVNENIWVNALFSDFVVRYSNQSGSPTEKGNYDYYMSGLDPAASPVIKREPNWIVTDVRFPNEAEAIKERGGILLRVERPNGAAESINLHPSETALDGHTFDYTINNIGSLDDLRESTRTFIDLLKLIKDGITH